MGAGARLGIRGHLPSEPRVGFSLEGGLRSYGDRVVPSVSVGIDLGGDFGMYSVLAPLLLGAAASDEDIKRDIQPRDPQDVLTALRSLDISEWRYSSETADVRHLGPMAQDFGRTFGLGDDDTTILCVDGVGVALASVQALDARLQTTERALDASRKTTTFLSILLAVGAFALVFLILLTRRRRFGIHEVGGAP